MTSWYRPRVGDCAAAIYDDRFGYRYFATPAERDTYYDAAQWIDQKHWRKVD